ncbi:MAG: hypothetical protein ACRD0K_06120 [Egibacteraceae bacterium]
MPSPVSDTRSDRVVVSFAAFLRRRARVAEEERAAAAAFAQEQRLAAMRLHPSNGAGRTRGHLREVVRSPDK